jgi:hypothetical protein
MKSTFEKYIVRKPIAPETGVKWGLPEIGIVDLNFFLRYGGPLKEANTMIEYSWIVKDSAFGVTEDKPPHKHNCDELFWFMGTNPSNSDDLGAEAEFWMGEDKETEVIKMNTSGVIYVPKGLLHLPVFFKKVKRPLLWTIIALNIGDTLKDTIKYPVRGI